MPIWIPSSLVEFILLGPADDRRQLQDSPILGDVWIEFGKAPASRCDLLISPYKTQHAGLVAKIINVEVGDKDDPDDEDDPNIAYLQGFVVAKLTFREVLRIVVPKTKWWADKWVSQSPTAAGNLSDQVARVETPNGDTQIFLHDATDRYFRPEVSTAFASKMTGIGCRASPLVIRAGVSSRRTEPAASV